MKNDGWYIIKDLPSFIDHARRLVFRFFGEVNKNASDSFTGLIAGLTPTEEDEMNNILSFSECEIIAKNFLKKKVNRKTKAIEYYINDKILTEMLESFNSRMVSNILNKLVNDGLLESAFDEERNDFIFWPVDPKSSEDSSN
ncbi:MAG: hypothetical protein EBZ62_00395 [Sphingobacteriia bacterium]|nr:hypothetical protein [Sphingobacteriia bacterium]